MSLKANFFKRTLKFRFDARTSRGAMKDKTSWFIRLWHERNPDVFGIGECGPLPGLSPDSAANMDEVLPDILNNLRDFNPGNTLPGSLRSLDKVIPPGLPAVRFAVETAWLDLANGGTRKIFDNTFISGRPITINGLIWMGDFDFMMAQANQKVAEGYRCIKLKIGGIHFEEECEILRYIRQKFSDERITLRLDANGSFKPEEGLEKLRILSAFDIHSIEQPLKPGASEIPALCSKSPIPIALDEELIGQENSRKELLRRIKPHYIILKPTLHGGMNSCSEWISAAESAGVRWWMTSALESNIGLNAVCQFAANYPITIPQGLGTGMLYSNNFRSPLKVEQGTILYDLTSSWEGLDP